MVFVTTKTATLPGSKGIASPASRCGRPLLHLFLLLGILLVSACGGGGGGDDKSKAKKVEISGSILIPGGTVTSTNPIGLQGAANRPVSLYRIDDSGNIIGSVIDSGTSDANGNYVLLLPSNISYSSDLIVEAQIDNNELARAIVLDESTDITPITEYITQKLIEEPNLDLSALPLEEVIELIEFVESLPLEPQPDLSSMLVEIAEFSDIAIEAEINDLATANPQIRLSGLLSVPAPPPAPRPAGVAQRPIPNTDVNLYRIDDDGNDVPPGTTIATATTNAEGVFTMLLPLGEVLSGDLELRSIVNGNIVRALVTDDQLIIDAVSEYLRDRFVQEDFDMANIPVAKLDGIDASVRLLAITETNDLASTLTVVDTVAGPTVSDEINDIIAEENTTAPVVAAAGPFALLENSANTTAVGGVTATDADPVGGVSGFSIIGGNTGNAFAIDNSGAISVANSIALDRETVPSFTLTIVATDGTNVSAGENVVVNLNDENDTAPVIAAAQAFSVAEDASSTDPVGNVNASDADTSGIADFSITGGNTGGAFAISAAGAITVANAGALDRESIPSYTLTLTATDGVNISAPETITVTINDANDNAPVVDAVGPFNVDEDAIDTTVVGTVTATDADTVGGIIGFNITAGNTGNAFAIDAAGVITVDDTSAIDYETATSFTLQVTATDGINTSAPQPVTIDINDANDTAPVVDAVGPFSVAEDALDGTVVGTVTASDVDSTVTGFNIVGGDTGGAFAIDNAGAITVADTTAIDFETATSFTLQVTATDGINTSAQQPVTVDVTDANDTAPVVGAAGPFTLPENSAANTPVGTVTATDVDTVGSVISYSIDAGNTGGAFTIDNAGAITVANSAPLDRETIASFTLTISATDDNANTSAGVDVVVNLSDENDTAPVVTPGQTFLVPNSAANSTLVDTVLATDADTTGSITNFSITAGNTGITFAIAANGQITVLDNTNLLAGSPYTLTLTATDGSNISAPETVGITVNITTGAPAAWDDFNWDDGSTWQ